MRLIDAEKLKEKIRSQDWKDNTMLRLALSWVYMLIDEEPAINMNSEKLGPCDKNPAANRADGCARQ